LDGEVLQTEEKLYLRVQWPQVYLASGLFTLILISGSAVPMYFFEVFTSSTSNHARIRDRGEYGKPPNCIVGLLVTLKQVCFRAFSFKHSSVSY
jgi:hypothetical protein